MRRPPGQDPCQGDARGWTPVFGCGRCWHGSRQFQPTLTVTEYQGPWEALGRHVGGGSAGQVRGTPPATVCLTIPCRAVGDARPRSARGCAGDGPNGRAARSDPVLAMLRTRPSVDEEARPDKAPRTRPSVYENGQPRRLAVIGLL